MNKKMTAAEARQRIKDAIASGLYKPGDGYWDLSSAGGPINGCALCGLFLGCGGGQGERYVGANRQREFLVFEANADMASIATLECGYEGWTASDSHHEIKSKPNRRSPWYKLGRDLRQGKL